MQIKVIARTKGPTLATDLQLLLGYFAHVSTLEDIQENVEDYIPVTARPIAMYNDHVTVWSSVFLDVERTLPIKTYKWFPYRLSDLSISMEEFKNKSKVNFSKAKKRKWQTMIDDCSL